MAKEARRLFTGCLLALIVLAGPDAGIAQESNPSVIAPPRAGLEAIPLPPLDTLEPAVAVQLRDGRAAVERAAGSSNRELSEAYGELAQTLHAYEFLEAADVSYRNASRLARDDFRWLHLRGYLYQQSGRFKEAADLYVDARRSRPDDHALAIRLGETYLGLGRLNEARAEFESALPRYPAAAQSGLGEVALRQGRFERAIEHFGAALERVPQATSIHYSLAMAYRGLGRLDEARAHLEKRGMGGIRAVDPLVEDLQTRVRGERALVMQGRRAYEAGRFEDAAAIFRRALDDVPDSIAARVNLGLAQTRLGNTVAAAREFETALLRDPANVDAHASLGMLLVGQGRDADAVDHLLAAFRQAPGDGNVSRALSSALVRLHREDEAIAVLIESRSVDPDDENALLSLSILLAHRERYRDAVALLEDANRGRPGRAATVTTLARLLASAPDRSIRNGTRALDLAMAVYGAEPAPVYAETVAMALAELGRCTEAADWIRRAVGAAERARDSAESTRLRGESVKYDSPSCRPPGP